MYIFKSLNKFNKFRGKFAPTTLVITAIVLGGIVFNAVFTISPAQTQVIYGGPEEADFSMAPTSEQVEVLALALPDGVYGQVDEDAQEAQIDAIVGNQDSTGRSEVILYTVKQGDTLSSIASRFGINVSTILAANPDIKPTALSIGVKLSILPEKGVLHIVRSGDTLGKISAAYGVTQSTIIRANGISGTLLKLGQELFIPGGTAESSHAYTGAYLPSSYIWPAKGSRGPIHGIRNPGYDIANVYGTSIVAAQDGIIELAQWGYNGGYGNRIVIAHAGGIKTLYAHMSDFAVSPGQAVKQGQVIGYMGSTGNSTGPHVHFEVRRY